MANNLDTIMNNEALSNSQLARFAQLSDKTVGKIRKNETDGSLNSQNKIVVGLNKNQDKVRKKDYTRDEIFFDRDNMQKAPKEKD
jgi:DNA-binding XRE family transcriptional regulator